MAQSTAGLAARYFFGDLIGGIVLFPVWWYTRGLMIAARGAMGAFASANRAIGFTVWLKNLFVPMYGETELSGKLVSFVVRLGVLAFRGVGVLAWGTTGIVMFFVHLLALPLSIIGILYNGLGWFIS
ncbi:hypothetical protein EPO34_00380 [Patescibacteria group bacterium]|nr:MAG: hypothetical protein EPO34_00380 [Patescibacteria group bacterium]